MAKERKESPIETLDRLLKEAGARLCLCFVCSHQPEYGPCKACGCKNPPYENPKRSET